MEPQWLTDSDLFAITNKSTFIRNLEEWVKRTPRTGRHQIVNFAKVSENAQNILEGCPHIALFLIYEKMGL